MSGARCLVFGGTGQIGGAVCDTLVRDGNRVFATCHSDCPSAPAIDTIAQYRLLQCDVTERQSVERVVTDIRQSCESLQSVIYAAGTFDDLLVDDTGTTVFHSIDSINPEAISRPFAVNTCGVFHAIQATLALLQAAGGGNIVLLGTLNGIKMIPSPAHFAAAKSALLGVTQALAKELGKYNIRINLLVPGIVNGKHLDSIPRRQQASYLKHTALERFAAPEEIAEVVNWFALENTYVTGQAVLIDGGL